MRKGEIKRETTETKIELQINLDGNGTYNITSGSGFFDHMLELFTRHGRFDLKLACTGDTHVNYHHTVEDIGIALGDGISQLLGDKKGIKRYGSFILPMDEVLILCAIDLSGRSHLNFDVELSKEKVGEFDTELVKEFFLGLSRHLRATIHIKQLAGENCHHIIEAIFKCFGRTLGQAVAIDKKYSDEIPSTKGLLA